jgi:uncharacterized protein YbbC (DUF1343 family)
VITQLSFRQPVRLLTAALVASLVVPAISQGQSAPPPPAGTTAARPPGAVRSGLEVLLDNPPEGLRGKRIGLITNPTGVGPDLRSDADLLAGRRDLRLVALFGPEHGIRGSSGAGAGVTNTTDPKTGLPVYSLYGGNR